MTEGVLVQVDNPLAFIHQSEEAESPVPGLALAGVMEGARPLFFEVQTLAVKTTLAMPRRVVHGIDYNKVLLLLAVLKKHVGLSTDQYDIYVNIAGGVDIKSPAADLAVLAAIISSIKDVAIARTSVFVGEVGLLGEVRKVHGMDKITHEAKRIGLSQVFSASTVKHCSKLPALLS